jgi:hypothetical protein
MIRSERRLTLERRQRRRMHPSRRLLILLSIIGACGRGENQKTKDSGVAQVSPVASTKPAGKPACPANGQWSECAVFDRLDHAGLAPRRDSSGGPVTIAPLTQHGTKYLLGSAELDVFVYPDARTRERDEARLDRSKFIEATDEPTLRGEPTIIRNVNLLAILRSRNDHQRERVSDALSAGPPQGHSDASTPRGNP